jgi:hypothetical protein
MERNESWKCLATAIAIQAVRDYRKAQEQLSIDPRSEFAIHTCDEVGRFFKGQWYRTLCDVNPGIIGMAQKEGIVV